MSATPEVIEKIKKLLRLARSSNPHEAQLALQRAMALAREHDVAVEGLNPDEQAKQYDLFWLIANGELAPLGKEEFWAQASRAGLKHKAANEPVAYFRLLGFRPERANFTISLPHDLLAWASFSD